MNKLFVTLISLFFCIFTYAQVQHGGVPISQEVSFISAKKIPTIKMPSFDVQQMLEEDEEINVKGNPYRFGKEFDVDFGINDSGHWETLPNGDKLWRLNIESKNAHSLNFQFDEFYLPEGSKLFIYNENYENVLGAFTEKNNKPYGRFSTTVIKGDKVTFEYYEPKNCTEAVQLNFLTVVHAYRNFYDNSLKDYGESGSCNINVNCNTNTTYDDAINSVALILDGGSRQCTGAMLNNINQDGTPFFLTANHCMPFNPSNIEFWTFMFNYQSPECFNQDGPTNQTVSGATLRANNSASDFMLLELTSPIPAEYNVYFNGWTNEALQPQMGVGIHHPSGDIKKISFDYDALQEEDAQDIGEPSFWEVSDWDEGTTEPGSSGSPIFNENGLLVGQLLGGAAACFNNEYDVYGKFSYSWGNYNNQNGSLAPWLNPNQMQITTLAGNYQSKLQARIDLAIGIEDNFANTFCQSSLDLPDITIKNLGIDPILTATISYQIDDETPVTYDWNGNLSTLENQIITLPTINSNYGNHILKVEITEINNGNDTDENINNDTILLPFTITEGQTLEITINADDYPEETIFQVLDSQNEAVFNSATLQANATNVLETCLSGGCYTFEISDIFGDGICCAYGNGSYELALSDSGVIHQGNGDFGDMATVDFCIETSELLPQIASINIVNDNTCIDSPIELSFSASNYDLATWTFEPSTISSPITNENPTISTAEAGVYEATLNLSNGEGTVQQSISFEVFDYATYQIISTESGLGVSSGTVEVQTNPATALVVWEDGIVANYRENIAEGTHNLTILSDGNCALSIQAEVGLTYDSPIFPNPVSNGILNCYNPNTDIQTLRIFDIGGRGVVDFSVENGVNQFDISALSSGIYVAHYQLNDETWIEKLLIP